MLAASSLIRDNFGIKPLYYHRGKGFLAFASEIKPLLTHPEISVTSPNESVVRQFLTTGLLDTTEDTFFEGIKHLLPSHLLIVQPDGNLRQEQYWQPTVSARLNGELQEQEISETRHLFLEAIRRQLVSDVPVGTCLSGGIDSSSVVCSIRKVHPEGAISTGSHTKTFSASFPGEVMDETDYAQLVCDVTEAEHNPVSPTAQDLWKDLRTLVRCQEEPFVSTSIYAQWCVMKRAREKGMTVMLDGQGGDELLCGYLPYYLSYLLTLKRTHHYFRLIIEAFRSRDLWRRFAISALKRRMNHLLFGSRRMTTAARSVLLNGPEMSGRMFTLSPFDDLAAVLKSQTGSTSLPALLRYEDKNSMWHSIEARVPFLDVPFSEYVISLPLDRKLRSGWTKYVFRAAMKDILPEKIRLRRSKIGFETPEKHWLEDNLRANIMQFFSSSELKATKFYDAEALKVLLARKSHTPDEISLVWRILNVELWLDEFFGRSSGIQENVPQTIR